MKALSFILFSPDELIKVNRLKEVKSHAIYEASTNNFHPEGLFSEEIFGRIGTPERSITDGYINLNTPMLNPYILEKLIEVKQLYGRVIQGKDYAYYDKETKDIEKCDENDPDANTGYSWFVSTLKQVKLDPNKTLSNKRKIKIENLLKYRDIWFTDKLIVLPAGLRDIEQVNKVLSKDDINNYYLTILSYAQRIPDTEELSTLALYDVVKSNMQMKILELYKYIANILSGKHGRIDATIGHKNIVSGTRNVISAIRHNNKEAKTYTPSVIISNPNLDNYIDFHTVRIPCIQAAIALRPFVIYHLKTGFFNFIFNNNDVTIPLIDKNNYDLKYVEVDYSEAQFFTTSEGIEALINKFINPHIRNLPAVVKGKDGKNYGMYLVYDDGKHISIFRSKHSFKTYMPNKDEKYLRLLTWIEMLYICTYKANIGKHYDNVRYPIAGQDSCFFAKGFIATTNPSRSVESRTIINIDEETIDTEEVTILPAYPSVDKHATYIDSLGVHFGRLGGQKGDHDGDVLSCNPIWSDDANAQIAENINSLAGVINPNKKLRFDPGKLDIGLFSLTFSDKLPN